MVVVVVRVPLLVLAVVLVTSISEIAKLVWQLVVKVALSSVLLLLLLSRCGCCYCRRCC